MSNERFIGTDAVCEMVGLSRVTIWKMEEAGRFPLHVKTGKRKNGWRESDVLAWMKARTPAIKASRPVIKPQRPNLRAIDWDKAHRFLHSAPDVWDALPINAANFDFGWSNPSRRAKARR